MAFASKQDTSEKLAQCVLLVILLVAGMTVMLNSSTPLVSMWGQRQNAQLVQKQKLLTKLERLGKSLREIQNSITVDDLFKPESGCTVSDICHNGDVVLLHYITRSGNESAGILEDRENVNRKEITLGSQNAIVEMPWSARVVGMCETMKRRISMPFQQVSIDVELIRIVKRDNIM